MNVKENLAQLVSQLNVTSSSDSALTESNSDSNLSYCKHSDG